MLMTSGANVIARTIPHMLGIALGFAAMLLLVGFGNGHFERLPLSLQNIEIPEPDLPCVPCN